MLESPHVESFINKPNKKGMTPLMIVSSTHVLYLQITTRKTVLIVTLIKPQIFVSCAQAARLKHVEIFQELLDFEADPLLKVSDLVDKKDSSVEADDAMGFAVKSNTVEIIDQLVMAGVPATPEAEALLNES